MEELVSNDVAKEVLTILFYCDNYFQQKMPEELLKNLTNLAADSNLEVHLDKNKNLQEQNLSSDALDLFSLLYYSYVAEDDEKEEIFSNWFLNDENTSG